MKEYVGMAITILLLMFGLGYIVNGVANLDTTHSYERGVMDYHNKIVVVDTLSNGNTIIVKLNKE